MSTRSTSRVGSLIATLTLLLAMVGLAPPATADTSPPSGTPGTVTADVLPTVQVNGVVWSQVIVGNKVYVAGSFSTARPAGSASGSNTVARANLLAYDIRTGALDTSFAPSLNAQALAVTASPDGSRVYVGGSFTSVNGSARYRIAAFDTATGALVPSFSPIVATTVRAIDATDSTVYLGGDFTSVAGQSRTYAAAVNASNGALLPWNPAPNAPVLAMTLNHSGSKFILGGRFTTAGGQTGIRGLAAVNPTTGTAMSWTATSVVLNSGTSGAVNSLAADADGVFGSGYVYGTNAGNLEGAFMADNETGAIKLIEDCHGDTYSVYPVGDVYYAAGHKHYCGNIVDGYLQTNPWSYYHSTAFTKAAAGTVTREYLGYFNWEGYPAPRLLHWMPNWTVGSYTGQSQATWSVTGNADYVVYGGEFPSVNGVAQQGLVRFARPGLAPRRNAPNANTGLTPSAQSYRSGQVRVGWLATFDRDNTALTYKVYRNFTSLSDTPIYETTVNSRFDKRPRLSFVDTTANPGTSYNYRVYAFDPDGNSVSRAATTVTTASSSVTPYRAAVLDDGANAYYRLGETSGTTALDTASSDNAVAAAGVTFGQAGALAGDGNTAAAFNGTTTGYASGQVSQPAPTTFSLEAWFRTTTTRGGKIVGYADKTTDTSNANDRTIYMDNAGHVLFGVMPSSRISIASPATYRDGQWHHVVATLGSGGMRLYVDGAQVASRSTVTTGRTYTGMWRIGGDTLAGWPSRPTSDWFAGSIDEVAAYPTVLTASQVANHRALALAGGSSNASPTARFTSTVNGLTAAVDGTTSSDPDGTIAGHSWSFGDGTPAASGATTTHTYAAAGTYTVTLTVTDDDGASGSVSHDVTVTDGGPADVLAQDAFGRSVATGWGSADTGGAWSTSGTASAFSVSGGAGLMRLTSGGQTLGATLGSVSSTSTDLTLTAAYDKAQTGGGTYLSVLGRRVSASSNYQANIRFESSGAVTARLSAISGGAETVLVRSTSSLLTYTPGQQVRIRLQVTGTSPTTVRLKVWADGASEPASWQLSATSSTSALQAAGSIGLSQYLSTTSTSTPLVLSVDDLTARPVG